jgi:hypothetical protein
MTLALASTLGGFTLAAVVSTACTAMDPGEVDTDMGAYPSLSATASASSTGSPSDGGGGGGDASISGGQDGGTTPHDGGTAPATCSTTVTAIPALFAGAPAWSSGGLPTQTAASLAGNKHNFSPLGSNPFGQDCSTCHKTGGGNGAGGFIWFVGGSITDCNGVGIGGAQVVMVAGDGGVLVNVYTDTDGNLWAGAPTGVTEIPDGAQVMVRLQNGVNQVMPKVLTAGTSAGCANSDCHGGSQGLPHVP